MSTLPSDFIGNALLEVNNVTKSFEKGGESNLVISSLTMSVGQGDFVALVGPSGCGKTTALRLMAGIIPCTSGQIRIRNKDIKENQRDIGFIFQAPTLLPWRNILDNVLLPLEVLGLNDDKGKNRGMDLLRKVGLDKAASAYPGQLSGGMQQRVGIARALIHNPSLLFMDEPFGALDAITRETLNFEIMDIWKEYKKTIVFVTHSINEAVLLSNRILIMDTNPGRIIQEIIVDIPRPRIRSHQTEERFTKIVAQIHETIDRVMSKNIS